MRPEVFHVGAFLTCMTFSASRRVKRGCVGGEENWNTFLSELFFRQWQDAAAFRACYAAGLKVWRDLQFETTCA